MGLKCLMGDVVGDMGCRSKLSRPVAVDWRSFHHELLLCLPLGVRVTSLVPVGLVICPSQYIPCFIREARAEANVLHLKSVWIEVSL